MSIYVTSRFLVLNPLLFSPPCRRGPTKPGFGFSKPGTEISVAAIENPVAAIVFSVAGMARRKSFGFCFAWLSPCTIFASKYNQGGFTRP